MTQIERVRRHIEQYGRISSLDAYREYGIMRLADVVFKLRKQFGWTIVTDIETSVNRFGEKVSFGVYRRLDAHPFQQIEKIS